MAQGRTLGGAGNWAGAEGTQEDEEEREGQEDGPGVVVGDGSGSIRDGEGESGVEWGSVLEEGETKPAIFFPCIGHKERSSLEKAG